MLPFQSKIDQYLFALRPHLPQYSMPMPTQLLQILLLLQPIFWIGIGKNYPFSLLGEQGPTLGILFWTLATLGFVTCLAFSRKISTKMPLSWTQIFKAWLVLAAVMNLGMDLIQWIHFKRFGYPFPSFLLAFDFILLTGIFFSAYKSKLENVLKLSLIFALGHRALAIFTFPLTIDRSDMLLAIQGGLQRITSGDSMYQLEPTSGGPLIYFPGTVLSYLPSYLLGIDLRWSGLLYFTILCAIIYKFISRTPLVLFLTILFLLNPTVGFRHELYLDFFWLIIFAVSLLAHRGRWILTALGSALALVTLQWSLILIPFWLMQSVPKKNFVRMVSSIGIVGFLGLMFLFLISKAEPEFMPITSLPFQWIQGDYRWDLCLGFAPLFFAFGLQKFLFTIQFLFLLCMEVLGLLEWLQLSNLKLGLRALLPLTALGFVILNPYLFNYFYLFVLLLFLPILEEKA